MAKFNENLCGECYMRSVQTVGRRGEEFRINSVNSSPGISRIYEIHYMVEAMDFFYCLQIL